MVEWIIWIGGQRDGRDESGWMDGWILCRQMSVGRMDEWILGGLMSVCRHIDEMGGNGWMVGRLDGWEGDG